MNVAEEKMENYKTDENEQLLADLKQFLAPLGVGLTWIASSDSYEFGCWRLFSKQDPSRPALLETGDGVNVLGYDKLETLHHELRSEISKIWVDGHYAANPYLGCKSLEEMQIRCDLLGK